MKTVSVLAHAFDCLPGHVHIRSSGSGSNVRVAIKAAVDVLFADERLKRKHIGDFKMSVVVISDRKLPDK